MVAVCVSCNNIINSIVALCVVEAVVCSVLSDVSCGVVLLSSFSTLVVILVSDFVEVLDTEFVLVSSSQPEKSNEAESKRANKDIGLHFIRIPPNCSLYLNYIKVVVSFSGQRKYKISAKTTYVL